MQGLLLQTKVKYSEHSEYFNKYAEIEVDRINIEFVKEG